MMIEAGCVPALVARLVARLGKMDDDVQANAAGALQSITFQEKAMLGRYANPLEVSWITIGVWVTAWGWQSTCRALTPGAVGGGLFTHPITRWRTRG
jgi:hypothetical protein